MAYLRFFSIGLLVVLAPALSGAFRGGGYLPHHRTTTPPRDVAFRSTSVSVSGSTDSTTIDEGMILGTEDDEANKAFLTRTISSTRKDDVLPNIMPSSSSSSSLLSTSPSSGPLDVVQPSSHRRPASILPGWVVEGHHPTIFEVEKGGIMMTERFVPRPVHVATPEERVTRAVSEDVALELELRGVKPLPPVYYFD